MNKNSQPKCVTRSRRAQQSMLNPMISFCSRIMLLRNGFYSTCGKYSIQTYSTCCFDSFYVIIAGLYADYRSVKKQIDQFVDRNKFSKMILETFSSTSSLNARQQRLLKLRNLILLDIFKESKEALSFLNGLFDVSCDTNANLIIPRLLPIEMYSYTRKKKCNLCNFPAIVSNRCFVDIDYNQYDILGIQKLNECLLNTLITEKTSICKCGAKEVITDTQFSSFIIIDLHLKTTIKKLKLNNIPKSLNILGIHFDLSGCMEFIGDADTQIKNIVRDGTDDQKSSEEKKIGHYIAHLYRSNNRWETYDDLKTKVSEPNIYDDIQGQVLVYVRK